MKLELIRNTCVVACALSLVAGCSSYPEEGKGGMGEYTATSEFSPVLPDEPLGPEHGLRFDFHLTQLHLDSLIQQGAEWCFPASVVQAKTKENRIARELEGGLLVDAANDIVIQRKNLGLLERRLDYVTNEAECVPPEHNLAFQSEVSVINQLVEILNVDNQFAVNSVEINPKYMGNLAEAANILKQYQHLNLRVTGHADASGTQSYNDTLAMGRAKQVERYLTIFGLSPTRIQTLSVGETLPLFEGDSPGVKLTNRRVSIDIVSTKSQGGGNAQY
ncbi:OmpA family protein [Vibrio agarivorans]|uniref:OmpA family protein n=1 Tax=Vibrio agarivorans TaxID=153622 RepID=A0ABT7XYR7_9VIBR|nr:OmpA family protein [Vibrio agarivorans]MDN2480890.1 OmpA family protein [Vibrio agarivorans]MDN3663080.1 OmpA family protein [Vibrio agarivorans]